jgi:hypothetical protein
VDNFVDNSGLPVDNRASYPQLSTGGQKGGLINSLSTACPQLIHSVIHRKNDKYMCEYEKNSKL